MSKQTIKKDTVVVGLGNVLLSDEGIGVYLVKILTAEHAETAEKKDVDFIEAGLGGMNLLHIIANRKKAVIIDCAKMGEKPGTMRRFSPQDVQSVKKLGQFSLHEADILQVINLSKQLGECPEEIVFFGIEPESLEPGQELSKTLSAKLDAYTAEISKG